MNLGLKSDGGLFDRVSLDCDHSASEKAICTNFQLFFVALVDRIRRLNSLQEAESALGTSIASGNDPEPGAVLHAALCDYEQYYGAPGQCMAQPNILQSCRDGIKTMQEFPFSKFLKSGSPKDDVYTPAIKAISWAVTNTGVIH